MKHQLTHDRLLELVHHDPGTGVFTRIAGPRVDLVGEKAGGPTSDGYERIALDGRRYRAHRLAWFYMTGKWPTCEGDHRDGDRKNNRWANLREATSVINKQNRRRANKTNTIGLLGVTKAPCSNRYRARIDGDHLGVFDTPEQAHAAYLNAKRERHVGCTL